MSVLIIAPGHSALQNNINFVIVSSDLGPYVSDTRVKRDAKRLTDHHLVSWIRWQRRIVDSPGAPKPKPIVQVHWENPAEVEALVHKIFNSHLQQNFKSITMNIRDIETE